MAVNGAPRRTDLRLVTVTLVLPLVAGCQSAPGPGPSAGSTTSGASSGSQISSPGTSVTGPGAAQGAPTGFTVIMSGDVLLHEPLLKTAAADAKVTSGRGATAPRFDFRPMLAAQKPAITGADLAICQLETPLAEEAGPYTGYPSFAAPPHIVPALKDTGYDACTTASNHTLDKGLSGLTRTLDLLDKHGIRHTGSARSAREAETPLVMEVKGIRVALLNYAYGTNGPKPAANRSWAVNFMDAGKITAEARKAKAAGADVVLVALHAGTEYQARPDSQQVEMVKKVTGSPDVDLVYGHHAHVVQPFDKVNGKWVAYGLGNTLARSARSISGMQTREEVMARFTFARRKDGGYAVTKAEYIPGYMPPTAPFRYVDLQASLGDTGLPAETRAEYERALRDIDETVTMLGADKEGLVRGR